MRDDWVIVQSMNGNSLSRTVSKPLLRSAATAAAAAARKMEEDDSPPPQPTRSTGALGVESGKKSLVLPPLRPGVAPVARDKKDTKAEPGSSFDSNGSANVVKQSTALSSGPSLNVDGTISATDTRSLVAFELLKSRFKMSLGSLNEKHFYQGTLQNIVTSTESGAVINTIAVGTGYHQRLGSNAKLLRVHIRGFFQWCPIDGETPPDTLMVNHPRAHFLVKRVKVPSTPGTPASGWTTGTNPPSGDLNCFQCLGSNVATYGSLLIAVKNPMAHVQNEIYRLHTFLPMSHRNGGPTAQLASNTALAYIYPNCEEFSYDIDLHGLTSDYPIAAQPTYPATNSIEWTAVSDIPAGTLGYKILLTVVCDLVFQDTPEH